MRLLQTIRERLERKGPRYRVTFVELSDATWRMYVEKRALLGWLYVPISENHKYDDYPSHDAARKKAIELILRDEEGDVRIVNAIKEGFYEEA